MTGRLLLLLVLPLSQISSAQLTNIPNWEQLDLSGTSTSLRKGDKTYIHCLHFTRPVPSTTAAQLTAINPALSKVLPDFGKLMASAEVSSNFAALYDRKAQKMKRGEFLTPHNYFDCETVLRLAHPDSGRKVLLLQADMDVVTDGSDPGRAPKLADYDLARSSDWFLPETAFSWPRSGGDSNPFLTYYPETLTKLQTLRKQLEENSKADPGVVWRELIQTCDDQIYRIKERGLHNYTKTNLRNRRFLLADRDPFVVLPVPWVKQNAAWTAKPGDYAAVIYKNRIYPAILGDAGPSDKVGEASLRLARELNPKANGKTRAISDLTVTYLYFPKTATRAQAPNLSLWHKKVSSLLTDIGGLGEGIELHQWTSPQE